MKKFIAEFVGTFAIVFCGTGAIIINQVSGGIITYVGISITFGLVVMAMIYIFPHAQFNPAVSIALAAFKMQDFFSASKHIAYQLLGALTASLLLHFLFPESETLGATLPSGSEIHSFILEIILMFLLMLSALKSSEHHPQLVGVVVGSEVLLEAMFAGPISGASMNPARSIAPAIVSGNLNSLWIYIVAPIIGALAAVFVSKKSS
ncbi:MAG: aquaporin [Flavobacteriales bacterium]